MIACYLDFIRGPLAWKVRTGQYENKKTWYQVLHNASGDDYRIIPDSKANIRAKMAGLIFSPIFFFPKAICRLGFLLSGNWARRGYGKGLKKWRIERYHLIADQKENLPGRVTLCAYAALYSLQFLADESLKFASLPLAAALTSASALLAIIDPWLSRRCFAQLEEAWSIDLDPNSKFQKLTNFIAPCMQPKRVWDQYNLYFSPRENELQKQILQDMLSARRTLEECKEYLPHELYEAEENKMNAEFPGIKKRLLRKDADLARETYEVSKIKNPLDALLNQCRSIADEGTLPSTPIRQPQFRQAV